MFVCNDVVLEFSDKSNFIIQRDMCSGVYILFQINLIFSTFHLREMIMMSLHTDLTVV